MRSYSTFDAAIPSNYSEQLLLLQTMLGPILYLGCYKILTAIPSVYLEYLLLFQVKLVVLFSAKSFVDCE